MPADRNPLVIEAISSPDAPYHVYLLVDPVTEPDVPRLLTASGRA